MARRRFSDRKMIVDRAAYRQVKRFLDAEVEEQAAKGSALTKKAIDVCQKEGNGSVYNKIIGVLLKVEAFFGAIGAGTMTGVAVGTTAMTLYFAIKEKIGFLKATKALMPGLAFILTSIMALLYAIGKWKAGSAISKEQ